MVLKKHDSLRSYILHTSDGKIYRRNRKHLLKTRGQNVPSASDQDDFDTEPDTTAALQREMSLDLPSVIKQACREELTNKQSKPNIITRSGREDKVPLSFKDVLE